MTPLFTIMESNTRITTLKGVHIMSEDNSSRSHYKRVLLKLGGEMFGGGAVGVDPDVVDSVAAQIAGIV